MTLKILLPFGLFLDEEDVLRVVAETAEGFFGLLPNRLDCVVALVPGILTYETPTEGEVFVAIDGGVLVKAGSEVRVSVRRALKGIGLAQLRESVEQEFLSLDEEEQEVRSLMTKLETGFIRRFAAFQDEP